MWSGLPSGEEPSSSKRKSVTSGWRVYESRIQSSLPLMNQHPEVINSLLRQLLFRGTFRQSLRAVPVQQYMLLRTGTCACGFPSPLHPDRAHGAQRFWLSASRLLLWTAHKAMAFQLCPEREKNCFLRLKHHVWRLWTVCSASRESRFPIFTFICCHHLSIYNLLIFL